MPLGQALSYIDFYITMPRNPIRSSAPDALHAQIKPLFAQGLQFHRQGEFDKAMRSYEQVLRLMPKHFEALHHVGIVAFQVGNFDMAAGFIRSALALNPNVAAAHSNLGNALKEMRQLDGALHSYDRALELNGGDADTWYNRGVALQALGRSEDALHSYDHALALNAGDDQAWSNRAVVLRQLEQYEPALQSAQHALALNPRNIEAHSNCGNILLAMVRLDEAEVSYRRALELAPDYADAHYNLGRLLLLSERYEEALVCYQKALSLKPRPATVIELRQGLIETYRKLGKVERKLGRSGSAAQVFEALLKLDDADHAIWQLHALALYESGRNEEGLASVARALAFKPDNADYHLTRAIILRTCLRYEEARQCCEKAVELAPHHPGAYTSLGSVLDLMGHADRALENYEQALALDPDYALAHWNRSQIDLRRGDYERGWRGYEWRWKTSNLGVYKGKRDFPQPVWSGREALAGKTILLHSEQGLGDALQFCRYATLVAQRGARVILEVQPPLVALLGTLAGVAGIVVKGEELPPFDYHIPLMSLPLAFDTRLDTVPPAPYLANDPARVAQWDALLGARTRPRVGVVWSGNPAHQNDHNRSVPLAMYARMFSDQCEFISLQKDVKPADQPLLDSLPVRQLADQLRDFSDTAALCELMDAVITVDTSVAHLAGALGTPVWILLQAPFEWRWLEHGSASAWYSSATLYRQIQAGDWQPVIDAVTADLGKLAAR